MTAHPRHALVALLLLLTPSWATAQYFGQNKVQYEDFDFRVKSTEHFDIYFYPEEEAAVGLAARMAERWYTRLSALLGHQLSGRQPLILYAAHPHFQQTSAIGGEIGEGTGGVTEMLKRRIVLPFAGGMAETDHVLGHELVHAFQFDMAARRDQDGNPTGPAVMQLPLWFIEGMAEYLSLGPIDANTAMWVRDAAAREKMPTVDQLDDPTFFPYRYGHAFWAYVAGRWGDAAVGNMLRATGPNGSIEAAMRAVLGVDKETFTREWHEATTRTYAPFIESTRTAEAFGRPLITRETSGGELNLAPSLSPDGRRVVFLSERSLFSIDMFLADASTGEVLRRLVQTAGDPHFDSLEFLSSAGDWAPDNRRFVFSALTRGQPVLTVIDVENGQREGEYPMPDVDQIFNPAWSPDGQQIAFSALHGGVLDLFLFDLKTRAVTQLTNDAFADLDPEWLPDGRRLLWVTDRFSSNLETLAFGTYMIGSLDVGTRQAQRVAGFDEGRNSNPEISADGRTVFFIGTPDGIPNIYRQDLGGDGEARPITRMRSGVSGITPLTPALSVAAAASTLVFTAFENDGYAIHTTTTGASEAASAGSGSGRSAAALPPIERRPGDVVRLLQSPATGLPQATTYPDMPYRARLSLDAVGQPTVGVGADRFGTYAAGGLALMWSDMLGRHEVGTTVQLTSRFEEVGGAVGYFNRTHRWNWGVVVEQTPYVTGAFAQGITTVDGLSALVQETLRVTQVNRAASGVLQYPFSRARRVEVSGGVRRISFDRDLETQYFSLTSGQLLDEVKEELPRADALNLGEVSAALVYDSSVFGVTSPILGQRYRFEYSQVGGSLLYAGVLADVRRYFMPARPFTIALRAMHYGRYGRDGEDIRLSPLYLGYPGLVRGYEVESFGANECALDTAACPAFDQVVGTRMALGSAELRFPLFSLFNRRQMYGPLPVEVALFADAGVAWTSEEKPTFLGGDRDWVRSVGAGLRFNAFGYAIGELDYVKPLDRNERGWVWQFNLTPGF